MSSHPVLSRLGRPSVNSHPVPVTAMEAVCELSPCQVTAMEAACDFPVLALSWLRRTAEDFLSSLATAPDTMKALPVCLSLFLPVVVCLCSPCVVYPCSPLVPGSVMATCPVCFPAVVSGPVCSAPVGSGSTLVGSRSVCSALGALVPSVLPWWALGLSALPWWAPGTSAPPWGAPVPSSPPWLPHGPGPPSLPLFRLRSTALLG